MSHRDLCAPGLPVQRRRRQAVHHRCAARPWLDCTAARWQCTAAGYQGVALCPQSYAEGRFPAGTSSRHFKLVMGPVPPQVCPSPCLTTGCSSNAMLFMPERPVQLLLDGAVDCEKTRIDCEKLAMFDAWTLMLSIN